MTDNLSLDKIEESLRIHGYFVYNQEINNLKEKYDLALSLCKNKEYERGSNYWIDFFNLKDSLKNLVYNNLVSELYSKQECLPRDVCITNEIKSDKISRNNYLHFDRLRSLKMLVYLSDVCVNSGPFVVCPNSHKKGSELRRKFNTSSEYKDKKNRIKIDYPKLEYNSEIPIIGPAGTTILFDSDVFHMGGNIKKGFSRTVIRSHWYKDYSWRVNS